MPVSVDTLRLQLDYSAWASQRLLDSAAKLSHEELTRDFKTADKTVLDPLAGGERRGVRALVGSSPAMERVRRLRCSSTAATVASRMAAMIPCDHTQ